MNTTTNTSGNGTVTIEQDDAFVTRECERCGEEYVDLKILADARALCSDCSEPMDMDLGRFKPIGSVDSRPFHEFGPLSLGVGGGPLSHGRGR